MLMSRMEKWDRLLSNKRVRLAADGAVELSGPHRPDVRSPYEIDYERVVFASPFRRLARKTQVHPFSEVDHVHNRLTHSIEVASVGHTLAREVGSFLVERGDLPPERVGHVCWTVQAAGLAHDIGNPPYGHSGEAAIQAWAEKLANELGDDPVWNDFRFFDGNAQTFRMMSRPDLRDTSYFRLTAAALGTLVKYPRLASHFPKGYAGQRKMAAFTSEETIFRAVWDELGLVRPDGSFMRHPLSYLSEAADDICYRIADFEDAVLMGLLPYDEVAEIFLKAIPSELHETNRGQPIQRLRALAIHHLIRAFVAQFEEHYDEIMDGTFDGDLRARLTGSEGESLDDIQRRYEVLFSNHRKVIAEIGSYSQFNFILTLFLRFLQKVTVERCPSFDELPAIVRHLVQLAWDRAYYEAHQHETRAWWAHAVLDFVVGMTDDYINALAHRLGA